MFIECVNEPSLFWPVTTALYLPVATFVGTDRPIVAVADWLYFIEKEGDAKLAVTPVSAEQDR